MSLTRGEVSGKWRQRVPVYNHPGQFAAMELEGRVCPVCHRNDLLTANRKGELVVVDGKSVHLACAEEKALVKQAESPRRIKPAEALKFKVSDDPGEAVRVEVQSIFILPLAALAAAKPKTARRWEKDFRLANLAVPKPGAAMAREAMAAQ